MNTPNVPSAWPEDSERIPWTRFIKPAIWSTVILVLMVGVFSSVFTVEADGKAVVKRFGQVIAIRDPGLHLKLPFGIDSATFVPTERVLKEEFGFRTAAARTRSRYRKTDSTERESLMLTGDLNVIDVEWVVQYRIREPERFLHQIRSQRKTIRDVAEAVMRRVVGNRLASDVLTIGRVSIAAAVRGSMQSILDSYSMGVQVTGVEMQDVTPPDPVKPAFNEVNEARQQKERLINLAEKERNQIIPKARGEAAQTVAESEAYRAERVNQAKGESARFTAVLARYREAEAVTRQRLFLESFDEIGPKLRQLYVVGENTAAPLPLLDFRGPKARTDAGGN